ncbi:unnamed protein product, partial [Mesorhabditis spiculigera]
MTWRRLVTSAYLSYQNGILNVEPVLLLITISTGLYATSQPLFTYWARCVELAASMYPEEANISSLCAMIAGDNETALQDLVEKDISATKIWLQIASSVPTFLIAPIIGTWSDKTGRKLPLLFAMSGFILYSFFNLLATLTYETSNIYFWFFLAEISIGFCGGATTLFTTMLAIVTDDCRNQLNPGSTMVPLRIGVASSIQSLGSLLGTLAVSLLAIPAYISVTGHAQSYVNCAVIQFTAVLIAFVYTIFYVKETHHPQLDPYTTAARFGGYLVRADSETSEVQPETGCIAKAKGYFNALMEVLLERRPGWTRLCLNLSIFFVFVEFLAMDAGLLFLLVKRQPFAWTDKKFSEFSVWRGLFFSLGMVLGPLMLSKMNVLGKDSLLIIIGSLFSAISFLILAFATTTQQIFATAFLAIFVGVISPGFRSFLPRMVPKEQTARLLTLISIVLAICPIISSLIFNNLFNWSIDWWPGFSFLICGCCQLFSAAGQGFIHRLMKPQWKLDKELRDHRKRLGLEPEGPAERLAHPVDPEERSVSNTAVGSDVNEELAQSLNA